MKEIPRKNLKLLLAAGLFLVLTALKLLFPAQTASARSALRELIGSDAGYVAALSALGEGLAGDGEVRSVFLELAGLGGGRETKPFTQETIADLRAALPQLTPVETPPAAEPEDAPEETPPAVAAFLEAQEQFADYPVPASVSYAYPELPFDYVSPVAGMTSSGFGYRLHPLKDEVLFHYGTDFAAWTGTEILAFAGGTVGMVGWDAGFGNYIIVQHDGGWRTLYAHCSAVYVTGGQAVQAGECIGLVGATGNVTGPHLHLELSCDGVYYNPEFYLA